MRIIASLAVVLFSSILAAAQLNARDDQCGYRPKIGTSKSTCYKPIVFGATGDGFPTKGHFKGEIVDVTFTDISCGVLCLWGSVKVKLYERPKGYSADALYLTVLCFVGNPDDYIGKRVELDARKTSEKFFEKRYCTIFRNFLDSSGTPFYYIWDKKPARKYRLNIAR